MVGIDENLYFLLSFAWIDNIINCVKRSINISLSLDSNIDKTMVLEDHVGLVLVNNQLYKIVIL